MFRKACEKIRESVYGTMGTSVVAQNGPQSTLNATNGTAFMIAPGYLVTAAHFVHQESDPNKPVHQYFEVIRAPEIGQSTEKAILIAEDSVRDIAILKIENPKNKQTVKLKNEIVPRGSNCGFLGFPLSSVEFMQNGTRNFKLSERFQGAYISNYTEILIALGKLLPFYEIDTLMYSGSSGCPGFNSEGEVIGMQVASVMQSSKTDGKSERIAISLVVPSVDILNFLKIQNILP
ncbi:MAG: serine protease [Patescibacteria group bacterium]